MKRYVFRFKYGFTIDERRSMNIEKFRAECDGLEGTLSPFWYHFDNVVNDIVLLNIDNIPSHSINKYKIGGRLVCSMSDLEEICN